MDKVTIPSIIHYFIEYTRLNIAGGNLHIILEDGNILTGDIDFCLTECIKKNDFDGIILCHILYCLSKTQRSKLIRLL